MLISALDLLSQGYDVHILADGVSSSNKEEIPIALERMRQAGACISTSESVAFQLQRKRLLSKSECAEPQRYILLLIIVDSAKPNFKIFAGTIKEEKERTREVLQTMLPIKSGM